HGAARACARWASARAGTWGPGACRRPARSPSPRPRIQPGQRPPQPPAGAKSGAPSRPRPKRTATDRGRRHYRHGPRSGRNPASASTEHPRPRRTQMAERAALVTGGSSGIGLAIARYLGQDGYSLTLSARRPDKLEGAAEGLRGEALEVESVPANVAQE